MLGFSYSTPNNTLPIFWSTENRWKPLLSHGESFRDPIYLIGPPPGLTKEITPESKDKILLESEQLDNYEILPDISINIFSEFKKTSIFLVLAPIIKKLEIESDVFTKLLKLIAALKHYEHEKGPICTAVFLVKSDLNINDIGESYITTDMSTSIANIDEVHALANITNGFEGTICINSKGILLGSIIYPANGTAIDPLLPSRYSAVSKMSEKIDGLLFLFLGNTRVTIFYNGYRLLTHRGANWHLQSTEINNALKKLSDNYTIQMATLSCVFKYVLTLSDKGKGALITIGDENNVLKHSDPPTLSHFKWCKLSLDNSNPNSIISLMEQDGATVISNDGKILQGMTSLRPPAGTIGEEEIGKGTKHSTASKISSVTNCLSIAISVDGRITLYGNGKIIFKIMG